MLPPGPGLRLPELYYKPPNMLHQGIIEQAPLTRQTSPQVLLLT